MGFEDIVVYYQTLFVLCARGRKKGGEDGEWRGKHRERGRSVLGCKTGG